MLSAYRGSIAAALMPGGGSDDADATTPAGVPVNISVPHLVTAVQSPTDRGGTAVIGTGGMSVVYTPPAGFTGLDSFTYGVA